MDKRPDTNATVQPDTAAEAQQVREYLDGMPPINIGALLMPPIWGPAKGIWATILWYPLWLFADNCIFAWWSEGSMLATITGFLTLVLLIAVTILFARLSAPVAALRAIHKGKTKEEFQHGERVWAIITFFLAVVFIGIATYYNLCVRVPLVA